MVLWFDPLGHGARPIPLDVSVGVCLNRPPHVCNIISQLTLEVASTFEKQAHFEYECPGPYVAPLPPTTTGRPLDVLVRVGGGGGAAGGTPSNAMANAALGVSRCTGLTPVRDTGRPAHETGRTDAYSANSQHMTTGWKLRDSPPPSHVCTRKALLRTRPCYNKKQVQKSCVPRGGPPKNMWSRANLCQGFFFGTMPSTFSLIVLQVPSGSTSFCAVGTL